MNVVNRCANQTQSLWEFASDLCSTVEGHEAVDVSLI
jgi:hypothetical protein